LESRSLLVGIILGVLIGSLGALAVYNVSPSQPVTQTVTLAQTTVTVTSWTTVVVTAQPPTTERPKWTSSDSGVVSWQDAGRYVGQVKTVEGTVVRTHRSASAIFLNFHDPYQGYFYVVIFQSDWASFKCTPESFYKGREVRVTGLIKMYQGSPEIIVSSPTQIEVAYTGIACQ
jgi:DNA/RNA endonuclease YhcR with UshA esterase domain